MVDAPLRRLAPLLAMQSGVVRRAQLRELGLADHDVARLVRRRALVRVHPGVYVDHTGPLSWEQRAWAAVLACWPAALAGGSAQRSGDHRRKGYADDGTPVEVLVDWSRSLRRPSGVRVRRSRHLRREVDWSLLPPRQRSRGWVLDLAAEAPTDLEAVAVIADAVGDRRVRPADLRAALAERSRIGRRRFLEAVVADAEAGTCSVLEHGYLQRVERAHGLPAAERQVRSSVKGLLYRDVEYVRFRTIVELDGRLNHTGIANRDRDLERDLDAAVDDRLTVRLGWGQVFGGECRTAARIGAILAGRGWEGVVHPCPRCRVGS
ncbi:hypothetical protein FHP29_08805 [Nocardioides albidus]|uniref:AbiEi antitoxin N-terminal domain-containing protein n=1 Tax=Nocardioides albidus TaxID=1517589 RepID=A0A5C4W0J6_9ACTN|nr:type IV toxin-antitoxin system AbiEi family antitoxin domain-containing protein [Nocardioides albidus]TNM41106.1 hypothetical protein FHP29_08805 [Nocardioides albidus]